MKHQALLRVLLFCTLFIFSYGISVGGNEPVVQLTKKSPSSSNASDGSISLAVSGGTGTFTIYFTSTTLPGKVYNQSSLSLDGLTAGTYLFTIQDSNGHIINKTVELTVSR